jgi:hypothetical protein
MVLVTGWVSGLPNNPIIIPVAQTGCSSEHPATLLVAPAWFRGDLKTIAYSLIACGVCFFALIALFVALLVLSLSLPSDSRIESRLRSAVETGLLTINNYPLSPYGTHGTEFDMFIDCAALGWNRPDDDKSLFYRIAAADVRVDLKNKRPCASLVDAITSGKATADDIYPRFWHGYQVYLRPMLLVMSLANLRRANAILLFAAFVLFGYQLAQRFGTLTWPVLVFPFAFVGDLLTAPFMTLQSVHLTWTFLSVAVVAVVLQRWDQENPAILPTTIFSIGAIANYVSLLINPPLAPTLIGFLVLAEYLSRAGPHRIMHATLNALIMTLLWFAGYALAWIAKWVLAALVLGIEPVMTNVLVGISASEYSYASRELARTMHILQPTWYVLSNGTPHLLALIAASWSIAGTLLAWGIACRRFTKNDLIDFFVLQLPLLIPVAWVEFMRTHSIEHHMLVYRNFLPFSFLPLLAVLMLIKKHGLLNNSETGKRKKIV